MATLFDYHRLAEIVLQWLGDAEIRATDFTGRERRDLLAFKDRAIKFLDAVGRLEMPKMSREEKEQLGEELEKEFIALREEARRLGLSSAPPFLLGEQS